MSSVMSPASADEALEMLTAAMGYLAAADATAMTAEEQARCLRVLERATSVGTAARTSVLSAFASGQGYSADADYSPRAWLIHKTGVTKGAAVAYTAWVRRAEDHPRVLAALATGDLPESVARILCQWTNRLPEDQRDLADEKLVAAALAKMSLQDLAELYGEIYEQSRSASPDEDNDEVFDDRAVRLITTFQGAGVLYGDLTPECAEAVAAVLDALAAPAGAEDDRSQEQRYHDALQEAMSRLIAAGILPERAGQPVKVWAHISLADLLRLDGSSALQEQWTAQVRARWAGHRAAASEGGGDTGAWLDGDAAEAIACDAAMAPIVTGDVNVAALEDLVRLCVELDRRRRATTPGTPAPPGPRSSGPSSARPSTCCPAPAGWPRSCGAGSSARGWAGRACRWTSGTPRPFPRGSATRSPCGTSTASGPGGATSPPRPARCTTPGTRPTAAPPRVKDCVLLCWFHHQVVIHRWGWTLVLNPDGTTTAWNKDKTKVLHSHGPPVRPG